MNLSLSSALDLPHSVAIDLTGKKNSVPGVYFWHDYLTTEVLWASILDPGFCVQQP